jgi:hypothetical protein
MKRLLMTLILLSATTAHAYEFKLQFTPQAGARGLDVAGYEFKYERGGEKVVGNCSYYILNAGSGGTTGTRTNHYSTCTWDLYGNLISITPGAPSAPQPESESGTEIVYATSGTSRTGQDTRGFGFVSTPSAHYSWTTVSGARTVIPYAVHTVTATIVSDGDFALKIDGDRVATAIIGTITPSAGTAKVSASTCGASLAVGSTCSLTITYDPTTIKCTPYPYGEAFTLIDLSLVTDAGAAKAFTEDFTVTGVPICND